MGQKVNPHGVRVGVIKDWSSTWYADSEFADNLVEDYNIRKFLKKKLYQAGVSDIKIERAGGKVKVTVFAAKPGLAIGKGGADIDATKAQLQKMTKKSVNVDIKEIKKPDNDAQLVAENIAAQLENRVSFRTETYSDGTIPLQTLRADIDYGFAEADTTYGKLGVKVWIYKGEILPTKENKEGGEK